MSEPSASSPLIEIRGLKKVYKRGKQEIPVLTDLNLDVPRGSFEALMGPSGSGKTTLLNIIAGIDPPTSGEVKINGVDISRLSESQLSTWRSQNVGFIFQSYNLLPVLTAYQNVELPLLLFGLSSADRKRRVETALRLVGLAERMDHYPRMLSGGQEQRVAIARAIVTDPQLIVADEPTGDLDRSSADEILKLLGMLNSKLGKTILMVTHDPEAAQCAQIIRRLDKGKLKATEERGADLVQH